MRCPQCGVAMRAGKKQNHPYRESGLPNVLIQVTVYQCPECKETLPQIPDVKGLHAAIADYLFQKPTQLTGPEIRFLRKEMGMRGKDLAALLGVTPVTVSRWETGAERVGPSPDRLVRCFYLFYRIEVGREVYPGQSFQRIREDLPKIQRLTRPKPLSITVPAVAHT
jgi:putative zinc finger/helix-turn-helix YgiT family protein